MQFPRLKQPLFTKEYPDTMPREHYQLIRAYDAIWNLHFEPEDMTLRQVAANAEANLHMIGDLLEKVIGDSIFEVDPQQLSFAEEVLNPPQTSHTTELTKGK